MDRAEALRAIDAGIALWWRTIGATPGFEVHRSDIEWVSSEGRAGPERIYAVRIQPCGAARRLDEIEAAMRTGALPGSMLLTPLSTPEDIAEQLRRRGLSISDADPCMALELDAYMPGASGPHIAAREVRSESALRDWAEIVNRALFGGELFTLAQYAAMLTLESTRFYLAYWDGAPASACMTVRGGQVATLECVATLPEYRRRGLARAAVSLALSGMQEDGVKIAALRAEPDGIRLYEELGFMEYCRRVVASVD